MAEIFGFFRRVDAAFEVEVFDRAVAPGDAAGDDHARRDAGGDAFASKGKNTPLDGATLKGRGVATVAGGVVVHESRET